MEAHNKMVKPTAITAVELANALGAAAYH